MSTFYKANSKAAKLDIQSVRGMRQEYSNGATQGELSRKYKISVGQVGRILRGEAWQWLPIEPTTQEIAQSQERLLAGLQAEGLVPQAPGKLSLEEIQRRQAQESEQQDEELARRVDGKPGIVQELKGELKQNTADKAVDEFLGNGKG